MYTSVDYFDMWIASWNTCSLLELCVYTKRCMISFIFVINYHRRNYRVLMHPDASSILVCLFHTCGAYGFVMVHFWNAKTSIGWIGFPSSSNPIFGLLMQTGSITIPRPVVYREPFMACLASSCLWTSSLFRFFFSLILFSIFQVGVE